MKKILSLAMLLCGFVALNAQNQIGFLYNGTTYQNGDTIVVTCEKTATSIESIDFVNQTPNVLNNLVVTLTEVERNGFEAWGLCTTQCVMGLTSSPFNLTDSFTNFSIDISIDQNVERPYGVYTMTVSNATLSCSVVVRFQAYTDNVGIDNVLANGSVKAYPNPAADQFSVSYSVEQPATLAIYDAQGRQIRQIPISGNGIAQVNGLPAGVYAYGIVSGKHRGQMQKLVVK